MKLVDHETKRNLKTLVGALLIVLAAVALAALICAR
jgi:hypothetical protein